jgi:hypothetical protein
MTTLAQAREAIYKEFDDVWSSGPVSVYTYDNEAFDPPNDAAWVRLAVRHQAATQETLGQSGNRRFVRFGAVFLQIFTPTDQGASEADTLVATARAIFEGNRISSTTVRFLDCIVQESGIVDDHWYQVVLEVQFEYNETK